MHKFSLINIRRCASPFVDTCQRTNRIFILWHSFTGKGFYAISVQLSSFDDEEYYRNCGYSKVNGADRTFTISPMKHAHQSHGDQTQSVIVKLKQLQHAFTCNPADKALRAQLISTLESLGCLSEAERLKKL